MESMTIRSGRIDDVAKKYATDLLDKGILEVVLVKDEQLTAIPLINGLRTLADEAGIDKGYSNTVKAVNYLVEQGILKEENGRYSLLR
jgi:hypothetical protein